MITLFPSLTHTLTGSFLNVNLRKDGVRERVKMSWAGLYEKRMRRKDRVLDRELKGKFMLRVP